MRWTESETIAMEFSLRLTATGGDGRCKESGKMGRLRKWIQLEQKIKT